ncbi:DUF4123 domain-containing protein [Shewanella surugensis]|uniref:DUF4123 domain-containing protein n=1 Tax=Shewanella surugensis TaxID=212020 RepID=A0ABT0LCX4_9GAMM|nr:DUF4123 domain-containing protein [Shewanella surugensis]MCL1125533.1 DUF4123 domain-containing protein [Shewanella surugensis]
MMQNVSVIRNAPAMQELDEALDHWLVADISRADDAMVQAYTHEKQPELRKLFIGSAFEYLADQSPVIFKISANSSLLPIWQQDAGWRTSSVLFSVPKGADVSVEGGLIEHLQALMRVKVTGKVILFRFYSSKIWQGVASELSANDINTILGPAAGLSWFDKQQSMQSLRREQRQHNNQPSKQKLIHSSEVWIAPPTPYVLQSTVWTKWI